MLSPRYLDGDVLFVKRLIDIVVSATLLMLLAPLFLLIAAAIKLTTPTLPVFYPWRVIGLNGRPFTGYKFTTMVADADEQKATLMSRNEMQGPVFKIKSDPRVTPLGRFLRKYSLNELPQLWSVLKGDMSLVGPRPAFRHELERYELWHKRKLTFKPGHHVPVAGQRPQPHQQFRRVGAAGPRIHRPLEPVARHAHPRPDRLGRVFRIRFLT